MRRTGPTTEPAPSQPHQWQAFYRTPATRRLHGADGRGPRRPGGPGRCCGTRVPACNPVSGLRPLPRQSDLRGCSPWSPLPRKGGGPVTAEYLAAEAITIAELGASVIDATDKGTF